MATAQSTRTKPSRTAERDPQVYHPLDQLRGIIRRYVIIEGVLSVMLFLALWFTLGLILDFGLFKTLGWDWVRDGAWWVRLVVLILAITIFTAILVFRIARRLTTEFSYASLALVLERKFPKVLGDRLITAVEMADVEAMGKFGYSKEMIQATIAEARERVAKVPVRDVFNWKRLWMLGLMAVGLIVGTLAFSYASYAVATKSVNPYRFGWKFAHVTGIFGERNVALMDTPWPRRAHIELVGFPDSGELTVGRDAPPPRITARAYKWVIADRTKVEGWRPLVWSDLTQDFVGRRVPALPQVITDNVKSEGSPSVDAIERVARETDETPAPELAAIREIIKWQMNNRVQDDPENPGHKKTVTTQDYEELQEVFKALSEKADEPSMGRTLRKLDLTEWVWQRDPAGNLVRDDDGNKIKIERPVEVTYKYSGKRTAGNGTLTPQQNNEFAGEIAGLKEDVDFVIRGADFESIPRKIRLIPPPSLKRLGRDQSEPAYLHHAPPQGEGYSFLEGKMQKVAAKDLSLTGDRTVFVVPAGTELTLTAEAFVNDDNQVSENDRITAVHAIPVSGRFPGTVYDDKARPTQTPIPLKLAEDGTAFSMTFKDNSKMPRKLAGGTDFIASTFLAGVANYRKYTDLRLTENVEFKVTWSNKYNVTTTRTFLIQVMQDQSPVVEVAVDVIRKVNNVYMVTPKARIPFNPDSFVKDDRGLSKVEYTYSYYSEDSDVVRGLRAKFALRTMLDFPLPGSMPNAAVALRHADNFKFLDLADNRISGSVFVGEFLTQQSKLTFITRGEFEAQLPLPIAEDVVAPTIKKIELKDPSRDYIDLDVRYPEGHPKAGERLFDLLPKTIDEVQAIYRMDINVQATDTNVDADGGPRVSRNVEPIRLRIVSENDLLIEIGKEQHQLAARLDEAILKLAAAMKKYEFVRNTNGYKEETPENVDAVKVRAQDAFGDVEKARDIVQSVSREYRRITRECEVNRLNDTTLNQYRVFTAKLEGILADPSTAEPVTFPLVQGMMTNVQNALNAGRWAPAISVTDTQNELYKLTSRLQAIRDEQGKTGTVEDLKAQLRTIKEKQERIRLEILEWQRIEDEDKKAKTPAIGEVGALSLVKGESKKLTHKIRWRQYPKDDVVVKVTASDPSITVPPDMNLSFDKHQFEFSYEIKAGSKEGAHTITLTPEVGNPVVVNVIVK